MTDHPHRHQAVDAPPLEWAVRVAELLAAPSPGESIAGRDRLAAIDRAALVRALASVVGDAAARPADRVQAAWLLKDLGEAAAAPALETAYLAAPAAHELRIQILDTLERTAFGAPDLLALDLPRLAAATSDRAQRGHLIALLATLGGAEAQGVLRQLAAADPGSRAQVVDELAGRPDAWVDQLLAALAADAGPGHAHAIDEAIAARGHETLRAQLSDPAGSQPVDVSLLRQLWSARDMALIADLAERGRLDAGAAAFLAGLDPQADLAGLSKSQRKLLARARAALAARSAR